MGLINIIPQYTRTQDDLREGKVESTGVKGCLYGPYILAISSLYAFVFFACLFILDIPTYRRYIIWPGRRVVIQFRADDVPPG